MRLKAELKGDKGHMPKTNQTSASPKSKRSSRAKAESAKPSQKQVRLAQEAEFLAGTLGARLGYQFRNPLLLLAALTHRSKNSDNNERLEFLGDAILGFIIADSLYGRFPAASEGELSRSRSHLVRGDTLAKLAKKLDLGEYLRMGPGELKSGGYRRNSILADALEALIGAIYLDGGIEPAKAFILRNYAETMTAMSLEQVAKDPKTQLQEYLQAHKMDLPVYEILTTSGDAHQQTFSVKCVIDKLNIETRGEGGSRRKAEQSAAKAALDKIRQ